MPYDAEISRANPTAFLFVVDQSGSMADRWGGGDSKAQFTSEALNRLIYELVTKCAKDEGVRDYFDVGVMGYHGGSARDALGFIGGALLRPISVVSDTPLRVEDRQKQVPDGAGGLVPQSVRFPVWFDPVADGGTPMRAALTMAAEAMAAWCDEHPTAFPPCVIHITDGESTDGDPRTEAEAIRSLGTDNGQVLLCNLHISSAAGARVMFPAALGDGPADAHARGLFEMSSELPELMVQAAESMGYAMRPGARGYGYNGGFEDLIAFFNVGTRPANLAR